jgi:hypothetical protein
MHPVIVRRRAGGEEDHAYSEEVDGVHWWHVEFQPPGSFTKVQGWVTEQPNGPGTRMSVGYSMPPHSEKKLRTSAAKAVYDLQQEWGPTTAQMVDSILPAFAAAALGEGFVVTVRSQSEMHADQETLTLHMATYFMVRCRCLQWIRRKPV